MEDDASPVEKVAQLRGVTWRWRDDAPADTQNEPTMGVIAQDVERLFPELVATDADGFKMVNYLGLVGPLIEAVKELDERLRALEARAQGTGP